MPDMWPPRGVGSEQYLHFEHIMCTQAYKKGNKKNNSTRSVRCKVNCHVLRRDVSKYCRKDTHQSPCTKQQLPCLPKHVKILAQYLLETQLLETLSIMLSLMFEQKVSVNFVLHIALLLLFICTAAKETGSVTASLRTFLPNKKETQSQRRESLLDMNLINTKWLRKKNKYRNIAWITLKCMVLSKIHWHVLQ